MRKKETDYFGLFIDLAEHSRQAALRLQDALEHYDPSNLPQQMEEMHQLEHSADQVKHTILHNLASEFISPIDREDILLLSNNLDDVTDAVEEVLQSLYMFHVEQIGENPRAFSILIVQCCENLKLMMEEFRHFRKSASLHERIVEMNRLENSGDSLYLKAMREVYATCTQAKELMAWTEILRHMEACCDICEHTANVVESVVMKNT
jgi:uncharacterized protein Yka (UPF0111/DUF47 family)